MSIKSILLTFGVITLCRGATIESRPDHGRIVGGEIAEDNYASGICSLRTGIVTKAHICGCGIISSRTVITAAHCVDLVIADIFLRRAVISVGTNNHNSGAIQYTVASRLNHPDYSSARVKSDVGLLFTNAPIEFNARVQPNVIPASHIGGNVALTALGWGRIQQGGVQSNSLKKLYTSSLTFQQCVDLRNEIQATWSGTLPQVSASEELCAYVGVGEGNCHGDSGSPLMLRGTNYQVGLVSWGVPCAIGGPDVFARLETFRDWIVQNTIP